MWHWHGDVSASHKAKMLKHPSGILQITPESLEALLLHKHSAISRLFGDLRFVVIDEVHSLLRGDRGGQTICLIERLGRMAGVNPRRIGLSATIGDPDAVGAFLSAGTGRGWVVPRVEEPRRSWRLSMQHFYQTGPQAADALAAPGMPSLREQVEQPDGSVVETDERPLPPLAEKTDTAPKEADPGLGYIFEHTRDKKCLVFANSREDAEAVCTELRRYCEVRHEPDRFLIHHGNLSSSLRESAEDAMRDDERQLTCVTTATLELGIDIGRLERALQIDAPFTVSAFLQRMGRTGRRGQPPEMWFVMREEQPEARALLPETIPWKLLQGIALVQLYQEEHWVEPPRLDRLPYSLLYHQTIATLASEGELSPAGLAQRVLNLTVFHRVTGDDFRVLLHHLLETDQIEQTESGGLIVGLAGERIANSFKFYAVFQENEEYTVRSDSAELGTVVQPPPPGEKIAIAGATWIVEEVDHKRHLVYATQVKGRVPAYFGECPGDIHTHVLERMRRVLSETRGYPYLMDNAAGRLVLARRAATAAQMVTAREPGGRHLGTLSLAGQLRLPGPGASAQDQVRATAGPQGARLVAALLHPVPDAGGSAGVLLGGGPGGHGRLRPHRAPLPRRAARVREVRQPAACRARAQGLRGRRARRGRHAHARARVGPARGAGGPSGRRGSPPAPLARRHRVARGLRGLRLRGPPPRAGAAHRPAHAEASP